MKSVVAGILLCLLSAPPTLAAEAPRVVVSIKPIHALVAALMEGVAVPDLIVKGAATPYGYRLTDADRTRVAQADLVIWVGRELEPFLVDRVAQKSADEVIELLSLQALKILPQRHRTELRDPYFWLDTRNVLILINLLTGALSDADPPRAHLYRNNHRQLRRELHELDRAFEYGYRGVSGRPVLLYHDTQQYFEQAYAMRAVGHLAERVGQTADAAALLEGREAVNEAKGGLCLLTEAGLPTDNLDLLASPGGDVQVVELDSHAGRFPAGPGLYAAMMRHNFDAIQACLRRLE